MIFFSHKCGQLGNRLFTFAHLIANAAANNLKISNLSFDEYARYFETTNQDVFCRYPSAKSLIKSNHFRSACLIANRGILKLLRRLNLRRSALHEIVVADMPEFKFGENRYYELDNPGFQQVVQQKNAIFLFGRFFRDYPNFQKYQNLIREFFRPIAGIQASVDRYMKVARKDADIVIGVHVRRGDYEQFAGGKYFYHQKDYCNALQLLQRNIPGQKIRFIICSNEQIQSELFKPVDFMIGPGHFIEDLYILSSCDLILGPPSTYSTWASFYGNKPLYQLVDLTQSPTLQDFVILPSHVLYNF